MRAGHVLRDFLAPLIKGRIGGGGGGAGGLFCVPLSNVVPSRVWSPVIITPGQRVPDETYCGDGGGVLTWAKEGKKKTR